MTLCKDKLCPGDAVYHPRYGFGTVRGLTRRDPAFPIREVVAGEGDSEQEQDYYDIQLQDSGNLLVPVKRAESVGLRLLTNGLEDIIACLHGSAQGLPDNSRERAAILRAQASSFEPMALACAVRDMLVQSRGRNLSASEKTWLDNACERLSAEAALVDHIERAAARAAIWQAVHEVSRR